MCRGYFYIFSLVVILTFFSINQVSAIRCYVCDSDIDGEDCVAGNQNKFAVECTHHSFLPTSEKQENHQEGTEYDCGYAQGKSTIDNKTRVRRGCAVKSTTCDIYKKIYKADHNIDVNDCRRCAADLCNSSGHLKTGMWSLSLCLIALYFFKL